MYQGRHGTDYCEHCFAKLHYINSKPNIQQARECSSKVLPDLGINSEAFRLNDEGYSGTAVSEATIGDLLEPLNDVRNKKQQLN